MRRETFFENGFGYVEESSNFGIKFSLCALHQGKTVLIQHGQHYFSFPSTIHCSHRGDEKLVQNFIASIKCMIVPVAFAMTLEQILGR